MNALARPDQKLSLYKLICSEFNISEEWLLNGTGEMYGSNEAEYSALIDRVMTGKTNLQRTFSRLLRCLMKRTGKALQAMIAKYLTIADAEAVPDYEDIPDTPEELEKQFPPVEKRRQKRRWVVPQWGRPATRFICILLVVSYL